VAGATGLAWASLQCRRLQDAQPVQASAALSRKLAASITGKDTSCVHGPLQSNVSSRNSSPKIKYDHCKQRMFESLI